MSFFDELRELTQADLETKLDDLVSNSIQEVMDSEAVSSEMAGTNATGFGVDDYSVEDVTVDDVQALGVGDQLRFDVSFNLSGDQDEDKPWSGDSISGEATAVIDSNGKISYEVSEASKDDEELPESDE